MLKAEIELSEKIVQLKVLAQDGKMRMTDCGNVIAVKRVLMYIRDKKPEDLRMEVLKHSDQLLAFTQQNLFEGRSAYENEFYGRTLPMFDEDSPHADRGYRS